MIYNFIKVLTKNEQNPCYIVPLCVAIQMKAVVKVVVSLGAVYESS